MKSGYIAYSYLTGWYCGHVHRVEKRAQVCARRANEGARRQGGYIDAEVVRVPLPLRWVGLRPYRGEE